jgi:hypothetical protein
MSSASQTMLRPRDLIVLLMMRCRPGTAQSYGRALLRAGGGPGSAAHRFAPPRAQMMEALVYALALRRIRDTRPVPSAVKVGVDRVCRAEEYRCDKRVAAKPIAARHEHSVCGARECHQVCV